MDCPACTSPLITVEYKDLEVDFCADCAGIWLDAGELELLYGDAARARAFLAAGGAARAPGEKRRRCPICGAKMEKAATGGPPPVTYDRCPRNHGLWLDQGELEAVLANGVPGPDSLAVVDVLREMFGR